MQDQHHPQYQSLGTILIDKIFRIPEYQRHYSWQKKQREELFEDIKKLQIIKVKYENRTHFMATIVCLKTKEKIPFGSNNFYIYDVVDGQQRLTTLVIMLKAISIKLKKSIDELKINEAKDLDRILVKDNSTLIILQANHDNRNILRNYLQDGQKPEAEFIKTSGDKNILDAIKDCERFVNINENPVKLLALIKNDLCFIFHSLEDQGVVYTIFEVLNSRGLDVDWLDKCKSLLMGLLYEHTSSSDNNDLFNHHLNELHSYWSEIYREIGLQDIPGDEIIAFGATLKEENDAGRPLKPEDALEFFKKDCTNASSSDLVINKIIENTIWLKEITFCLCKLHSDKKREAVIKIRQVRLLAVAIMLRKDLSEVDRVRLLDQWERTSFKIYGFHDEDARDNVGDYVRLAKFICKDRTTNIDNLLGHISQIGTDVHIDSAVIERFNKVDLYTKWTKELRYFFFRYEEHLSKISGTQINQAIWYDIWESDLNDTIEHILPQTKTNPGWNHITDVEHQEFLHSIGNLCLLSPKLNREASNKCFNEKKKIYNRASLITLKDIMCDDRGLERDIWDKDAINFRKEQLIKFAIEQWKDL